MSLGRYNLSDDEEKQLLMITIEHVKLALRALDRDCPPDEKQHILERVKSLRAERDRLLGQ